MYSFKGEFLLLGGLLGKGFDSGSASKERVDFGQQVCIVQRGVKVHWSYPFSLWQGEIIMIVGVLHFWSLVDYFLVG